MATTFGAGCDPAPSYDFAPAYVIEIEDEDSDGTMEFDFCNMPGAYPPVPRFVKWSPDLEMGKNNQISCKLWFADKALDLYLALYNTLVAIQSQEDGSYPKFTTSGNASVSLWLLEDGLSSDGFPSISTLRRMTIEIEDDNPRCFQTIDAFFRGWRATSMWTSLRQSERIAGVLGHQLPKYRVRYASHHGVRAISIQRTGARADQRLPLVDETNFPACYEIDLIIYRSRPESISPGKSRISTLTHQSTGYLKALDRKRGLMEA